MTAHASGEVTCIIFGHSNPNRGLEPTASKPCCPPSILFNNIMAISSRSIVLFNARVSSIILTLQILFPYQFYNSHFTRAVSRWTGLVRSMLGLH